MKSMAQAVRRIAPMAKGERSIDGVTLRSSAIVIANHGGDFVRLFPKGSGGAQSEAKPEIWSDMEGFNRRAVAMTAAAATLVALSNSIKQPALSEQFKSLGGACSACHRQFCAKRFNCLKLSVQRAKGTGASNNGEAGRTICARYHDRCRNQSPLARNAMAITRFGPIPHRY